MAEAAQSQGLPVSPKLNPNNGMKSASSEAREHAVELGDPPAANPAPNPPTFWTRLQTGWSEVEDQLAEWFGLNQSKYQWAVDELMERQFAGDHQVASSRGNVEGLQMQDIQEQSMERDLKR